VTRTPTEVAVTAKADLPDEAFTDGPSFSR